MKKDEAASGDYLSRPVIQLAAFSPPSEEGLEF